MLSTYCKVNCTHIGQHTHSSTCLSHTALQGDIYLFGGEYFDGAADKQYTYADLYRYQTSRNKWSRIIAPKGYHNLHIAVVILTAACYHTLFSSSMLRYHVLSYIKSMGYVAMFLKVLPARLGLHVLLGSNVGRKLLDPATALSVNTLPACNMVAGLL